MKYSVKQMQQALKDGKVIWFYHEGSGDLLYKGYLEDDRIQVEWEGGKTSYPYNSEDTVLEHWVCTKIEGEVTVTNKPHKHAELIKKWADGAIVQWHNQDGRWYDVRANRPTWDEEVEYRIKPTIVKKWHWVYRDSFWKLKVTTSCYTEQDFNEKFPRLTLIQKIDSTMIEVEE